MATEKRLIDPCALIEEITVMKKIDPYKKRRSLAERWVRNGGYDILLLLVKRFPTVEAVEVKRGQWEQDGIYNRCSVCHKITMMPHLKDLARFNFCPYCGAKMDGGADNGKAD